ncbi:RNA-directed DNA polymerase, eukaryota [Tanacetum coccineum]
MEIDTCPKEVDAAATTIVCSIFTTLFVHLGVKVGGAMSRIKSCDDVVVKVSSRLSKWKLKTLLIGLVVRRHVSSVYLFVNVLEIRILPKEEVATRWVKVMPIKINVLYWRVCLDKLPTRLNLSLKGIDTLTIVCPLCHASVEFGSHILFSCPMARHLWRQLMRWWELEDIDLASYDDWLIWLNSSRLSKRLKKILEGVCM